MKKFINYRLLPILLLAMVLGILVVSIFNVALLVVVLLILVILVLSAIFIKRYRKHLGRIIVIALVCGLGMGATSIAILTKNNINIYCDNAEINGEISIIEKVDSELSWVFLENTIYNSENKSGKLAGLSRVQLKNNLNLKEGDKINFMADVHSIRLEVTDTFSVRDYREGINYELNLNEFLSSQTGKPKVSSKIRNDIKLTLDKFTSPKVSGFIYAMMFGDKGFLSGEIKYSFSETGTAHVFAVSGLHIGIIALLIIYITKRLKIKGIFQFLILVSVLFSYSILCGFSPSVVRASVMIMVFHIAQLLGLKNDSISTLSCAGLIILTFSPISLFDISFIMSFLAVTGLVFFSRTIRKKLSYLPQTLQDATSASIAVNIGLLPVILFYFGDVSLLFLATNIVIIPIIGIIFPLVLVVVFLAILLPFIGYILVPLGAIFELIINFNIAISKIPFLTINVGMEWYLIVLYLAFMVAMSPYFFMNKKIKNIVIVVLLVVVLLSFTFSADGVLDRSEDLIGIQSDYYTDYVLLRSKDLGDYLIVNGEVNRYGIDGVKNFLQDKKIYRLKGVIKYRYNVDELKLIKAEQAFLNTDTYFTKHDFPIYNEYLGNNLALGSLDERIQIYFNVEGEINLIINDVNILFASKKEDFIQIPSMDYDLIYSKGVDNSAEQLNPYFLVSNTAYNSYLQNAVSNNFTFRLNNGKIKKRVQF